MPRWPISDDRLREMYAGGRGNADARWFARFWGRPFGAGLLPRRWVTLEVPGRKSGKATSFPLGMADVDGRWYLVSMLGECNWVANVRAADGYAILRRRHRRPVQLLELPPHRRSPILARYVEIAPGGRPHIPISKGSSLEEFADVAENHPVFEVLEDRRGDDVATARVAREHVMTRPSTEMMRSMVKTAAKAPSSHNTQPWTLCIIEDRIELVADRTRALPVTDPDDRELTISCGAALFNLELAAKAQGFEPQVSLLPDPSDPDLFARVTFDQSTDTVPSSTATLFDAIESRHTTRKPFKSVDNLEDIRAMLAVAAKEHDVHLLLDVDRETLADLVAEGDRAQFGDPHWRRELASWMHPRRKGDGLVVPHVFGLGTRAIVRLVNLGSSTASTDRNLVIGAPIIAVVSTDTDGPQSWLATGRALQHLLLVAASEGLSAGYENQPCQVTGIRPRFRSLIAQGFPQLVIRMGRTEEPKQRTPRRQFEDFATVTSRRPGAPSVPGRCSTMWARSSGVDDLGVAWDPQMLDGVPKRQG